MFGADVVSSSTYWGAVKHCPVGLFSVSLSTPLGCCEEEERRVADHGVSWPASIVAGICCGRETALWQAGQALSHGRQWVVVTMIDVVHEACTKSSSSKLAVLKTF